MTNTLDLSNFRTLPQNAAEYIRTNGWTQGTEENNQGHVCLTGALRLCNPIPGDSYIAREVFRRRNHAENWNDQNGRTADEVITYLATTEITDQELAETFGPQWREIVQQVRTISGATPEQITGLAAAWAAAWDAAWAAAWDAAWAAARDAAWAAARDAAWAAARDAARDAARALVVRDLIGRHGFTQAHYDLLTGPYRKVFGAQSLHVDDADL